MPVVLIFWKLVTSSLYNISITQTSIGGQASDLVYSAIFDSGTSFTYLNDPAYTLIAESVSSFSSESWYLLDFLPFVYLLLVLFLQFNNMVKETRHSSTEVPFDYCYDIRSFISAQILPFSCALCSVILQALTSNLNAVLIKLSRKFPQWL
jgi:hypothetical protein